MTKMGEFLSEYVHEASNVNAVIVALANNLFRLQGGYSTPSYWNAHLVLAPGSTDSGNFTLRGSIVFADGSSFEGEANANLLRAILSVFAVVVQAGFREIAHVGDFEDTEATMNALAFVEQMALDMPEELFAHEMGQLPGVKRSEALEVHRLVSGS
jgi:hypothetical protein